MIRIISFIVLAISLSNHVLAQRFSGSASNRFQLGAKMVEQDIEYISADSTTVFKVKYNLFIHEPLAEKIRKDDFTTSHINAKIRLKNQGRKICARNINADECTVYFWTDLEDVPSLTNQEENVRRLELAPGIYKKIKTKRGAFSWFGEERVTKERDPNGAIYSIEDLEADLESDSDFEY